jgi:hypothetical protein
MADVYLNTVAIESVGIIQGTRQRKNAIKYECRLEIICCPVWLDYLYDFDYLCDSDGRRILTAQSDLPQTFEGTHGKGTAEFNHD